MARISTVCVDDDLASCETGVTLRSADYESAGRVDENLCIFVNHAFRNDRIDDIFSYILMNLML